MESINEDILNFVTTPSEEGYLAVDWSNGNGYGEGNGEGTGCGGYNLNGLGIAFKVTSCSELRGLASFQGQVVYHLEDMPIIIYKVSDNVAEAAKVQIDMTLQNGYVVKYHNTFAFDEDKEEAYKKAKDLSERKGE